ncbi:MAG TPA: PilZ domain-containing protein [Spongiibacteraceae bacterium]|jgi:c-di-GMP-binding flagellar brake protein YcgR
MQNLATAEAGNPVLRREQIALRHEKIVLDHEQSEQSQLKPDLIEAQGTHAIIGVCIEGSSENYQSTIVDVDVGRKVIITDEMFPHGFAGRPGQTVAVTLRLAGNQCKTFSTRLLARTKHAESVQYQLVLPEYLSYSQRREAYRFRLPQTAAANVEFTTADGYFCSGVLQDISLNGMRIALRNQIALRMGDALTQLCFEFAGLKFRCNATVMNFHNDISGNLSIGIEFAAMPRPQQRLLEQILARWHRERARKNAAAKIGD